MILKTHHLQIAAGEHAVSFDIICVLLIVNFPINFDHQASGMAVEIHDIPINKLLPAKVQT